MLSPQAILKELIPRHQEGTLSSGEAANWVNWAAKAEQVSAQRVPPQHLLHLQGQGREAFPHIGVAGRQPHSHARGNRDHRRRPSVSAAIAIVPHSRLRKPLWSSRPTSTSRLPWPTFHAELRNIPRKITVRLHNNMPLRPAYRIRTTRSRHQAGIQRKRTNVSVLQLSVHHCACAVFPLVVSCIGDMVHVILVRACRSVACVRR